MGRSIIHNPYDDYTIFIGKRKAGKSQLYTCANVCVFPSAVAIPNDDSLHLNNTCLTSYTARATLLPPSRAAANHIDIGSANDDVTYSNQDGVSDHQYQ